MTSIETISIVIAAASVVIGVILSLNSRKQELETRQAELFMNVYNRWNTSEIQTAYGNLRWLYPPPPETEAEFERYVQQIGIWSGDRENIERWLQQQLLVTYFEGLGVLVKQDLINIKLVDDLFAGRIKWFWETGKQSFQYIRRTLHDPDMYDSIEYLYHTIIERDQQGKSIS